MRGLLTLVLCAICLFANAQDASELFEQGQAAYQAEQFEEALNYFSQTLEADPSQQTVYFNRGLTKEALGDFKGAAKDYQQFIATSEDSFEGHFKLAQSFMSLKKFEQALSGFQECQRIDSSDFKPHYNVGICHYQLGNCESALAAFEKLLIGPSNEEQNLDPAYVVSKLLSRYYGALCYNEIGQHEKALEQLLILYASDSTQMKFVLEMANTFFELNNSSQALNLYDSYIDQVKENPSAYFNRGITRSKLGNSQGAIDDFTKAIELDKTNGNYYYNRALDYYYIGKHDEAEDDFTQAIFYSEDAVDAHYFRGKLLVDRKAYEDALDDLAIARKHRPEDEELRRMQTMAQINVFISNYWIYLVCLILIMINIGLLLIKRKKRLEEAEERN